MQEQLLVVEGFMCGFMISDLKTCRKGTCCRWQDSEVEECEASSDKTQPVGNELSLRLKPKFSGFKHQILPTLNTFLAQLFRLHTRPIRHTYLFRHYKRPSHTARA